MLRLIFLHMAFTVGRENTEQWKRWIQKLPTPLNPSSAIEKRRRSPNQIIKKLTGVTELWPFCPKRSLFLPYFCVWKKPENLIKSTFSGLLEIVRLELMTPWMPLEYLAFCKYTGLLTGSKNGLFISKTDICKFCCCEYLQHLFVSGVTFLWPRFGILLWF